MGAQRLGHERARGGGARKAAAAVLGIALLLSACGSPSKNAASTTTSSSAPMTTTTTVAPTTTTSTTAPAPTTTTPTSIEGSEITELPESPTASGTTAEPHLSSPAAQRSYLRGVFADIQSMWRSEFDKANVPYTEGHLVIFTGKVETACGTETSDVGPFYCSGDHTVYLDISFFRALRAQFGISGEFAEAYIVGHELGHHVQNLLGITHRVAAASHSEPSLSNPLSVRVELQADCLSGVWAHTVYKRDKLNEGDIESALRAAEVVGDDYLARASGAEPNRDNFTHGTSAQRQQWFTTGFEKGTPDACDTFQGNV